MKNEDIFSLTRSQIGRLGEAVSKPKTPVKKYRDSRRKKRS